MKQRKRWQFILITAVMFLTVYNILPTLLYYTKPLKVPIHKKQAHKIARADINRVNQLETATIEWLDSFNTLLKIQSTSIKLDENNPQLVHLQFADPKDAKTFKQYLPRAGSLIPFVPSQLSLSPIDVDRDPSLVTVQRNIPIHLDPDALDDYFKFTPKKSQEGAIAPLYQKVIDDRVLQLGLAIGGVSENAQQMAVILNHTNHPRFDEFLLQLSGNILTYAHLFGEHSPLAKRYFATLTQDNAPHKKERIDGLINAFEQLKNQVRLKRIGMEKKESAIRDQGGFLDSIDQQKLEFLSMREEQLFSTLAILRKQLYAFAEGPTPWNAQKLREEIALSSKNTAPSPLIQTLTTGKLNPLIQTILIDWNNEKISLEFHPDILAFKKSLENDPSKKTLLDQFKKLIYNEIAHIGRETGEKLLPFQDAFQIDLNHLTNSTSLLIMDLGAIAAKEADQLKELIKTQWKPSHPDLKQTAFPIWDYQTFQTLSPQKQRLGLLIYAPTQFEETAPAGFHISSVYVIAKGIEEIYNKLSANPNSPHAQAFFQDFNALRELLRNHGFFEYSGNTYPLSANFSHDFFFESEDFYRTILNATREDFTVHGTHKYATLEFSNVEQRILALNQIETAEHEDLLKWRDEYQAAQVNPDPQTKYDIPHPTKNPLLNNLALSLRKYFRGDQRKILHWGLDLSGGKTVQIELRDSKGRIVTNPADLKQGIDELYKRVNKMGLSEVIIRQEGSHITLDFPSAQGLSATDLIKASSMSFHVVNEKFNPQNSPLSASLTQFLQGVWNEAVVTNRKDPESINLIAWKHLYGDILDTEIVQPVSEIAKTLHEQGLRLSSPSSPTSSSAFNDKLSKIAIMRGENFADWHGQTHPLLIVMNNYALKGTDLTNVHAGYDPSRGNFLSFEVQSSQKTSKGEILTPRNTLYNWTSAFSKEKIQGTPLGEFSHNNGWRMAVILNGQIIQAPAIESALRDHVSITGSFTQREANRLEADLKAGSLSFTPHILSEKNVSPELGLKDRTMGILATIVALFFVIALMMSYYRFAGLVASFAVIFNLLIMWATLQNIQATITLAGIAGIILTLGMAVDANVLVFERIREEFALSGRLASAIHTGYRKAFSAILDSNITTIIAALILLHFDSGPIKGFALTLIIGIASSMFTALFMTRYFFTRWVQNSKHKVLKMANLIKTSGFNFLKYGNFSFGIVLIIILTGGYFFLAERSSILGMDFTGGYSLSLEITPKAHTDYRSQVEAALLSSGSSAQDFQVRELSPTNNIKILLGKSLDQAGNPFYNMPLESSDQETTYSYQNNPRLVWVVNALEKQGLHLTTRSLKELDNNWTNISGQLSDSMRNSAIIGLSLALLCILLYITIRFEFKYAISATLGLVIDVIVTLSFMSILHALKIPIQIDLNTIAALMTIIGYSLNDTIIIFDRIREDLKLMRKHSFKEIINHALNLTLSRTVMTSGTTLVVLIALLLLGGNAIFGLSLVMTIGVIFGTFSSLFIAAPLLLVFHKKEKVKKLKWSEKSY